MARASRAEWAKRVERWKDSGLTAREYAGEIGVNEKSLHFWSWKLRKEGIATAGFRRSKEGARRAKGRGMQPAMTFVEVMPHKTSRAAPFELVMGNLVVRIPPDFDDDALHRLFAIAERRT